MKTVYIETSIVSYLTARASYDVRIIAWQEMTARWWQTAPEQYDLYVSELVRQEAGRGDAGAAGRRVASISMLPELKHLPEAKCLAERFLNSGAIPSAAGDDAAHVALAAVHNMDFLLTWNCRHINNPETKPLIRRLCGEQGFACPEICTPYELLKEEVRL
ncbi:MAG: DNA-binding protein [bacterium]